MSDPIEPTIEALQIQALARTEIMNRLEVQGCAPEQIAEHFDVDVTRTGR